jgi:hypothetical protein
MAIEMRPVSSSISVIDTLSLTNCGTDVSCLRYCQRKQKKCGDFRRFHAPFGHQISTTQSQINEIERGSVESGAPNKAPNCPFVLRRINDHGFGPFWARKIPQSSP